MPALVFAKLFLGSGGGALMLSGRLVQMHSFARMHKVSAISWLPIPALVGPIVGPPIGGVLVTDLDWRWIFYIIVPTEMVGIVVVSLHVRNFKGAEITSFDWRFFPA